MKEVTLNINDLKINDHNPRIIREPKFIKLVDSLLVFPKMLSIRPIVVDGDNVVLGGNMRCDALKHITTLPLSEIESRIDNSSKFNDIDASEVKAFWADFKKAPKLKVVRADNLTEDEKREFIIKDNASFGEWDWDALANEWNDVPLNDFGLDVWDTSNSDQSPDDNSGEAGSSEGDPNYVIQYNIVFNNEAEQAAWFEFIAKLKTLYPNAETISERLYNYIKDSE